MLFFVHATFWLLMPIWRCDVALTSCASGRSPMVWPFNSNKTSSAVVLHSSITNYKSSVLGKQKLFFLNFRIGHILGSISVVILPFSQKKTQDIYVRRVSWSLNCSELKCFLYVHHEMNSYPSLVPGYAVKYHSGISAPSGLKQYCYKCFCVPFVP